MAVERMRLESCRKGDRVLLRFASDNYTPLLEHVKKMEKGEVPNLRLVFAKRLDEMVGHVQDYSTGRTAVGLRPPEDGSFILLSCTAPHESPARLLGPVFTVGEGLGREGARIFYNSGRIPERWFEISEARVRLEQGAVPEARKGVYYLDCMKIMLAMEQLSRAELPYGNVMVRKEVQKEAYFAFEHTARMGWRTTEEFNWYYGQRMQVARIISYLNNANENSGRGESRVLASRRLGRDGIDTWRGDEALFAGRTAEILLYRLGWEGMAEAPNTPLITGQVLNALVMDGSIDLVPAGTPLGSTIDWIASHGSGGPAMARHLDEL